MVLQMVRRLVNRLFKFIQRRRLKDLRRRGLQMADDCRLMDMPSFGSEPFLISIGKHVTISGRVSFITHDGATHVFRHLPGFEGVIRYGRITIHENCFIGLGATILPGVTIGPNTVVAAGALVTKDAPPNTIVGGNPAQVITEIDRYAQKVKDTTPAFDMEAYVRDKQSELLRLYPYPW